MEINKQKEIKILNDPVDAVRKLVDVYLGSKGNKGYLNMYREILQNSLDEIIKGNTLDKNIVVSFDARTITCIIEDNGQGIDLNMLEKVFSVLHSSSNYDKAAGSGDYSSGKNGMGATITNFLSSFFTVESYRMDGSAKRVSFEEGRLKESKSIKCPKGKHGLITSFAPSAVMEQITVDDVEIESLTWMLCHLCKIGTKITFNAINKLNQKRTVIIENKNGIYDLIDTICEKAVITPIHFGADNGSMKIEVLFSYDIANLSDPNINILGFANMCPTNGGTHIDGFLAGIVKYFRDYMNKIYLANNKKLQVNANDIRTALRAVISIFHIAPLFTGQSKEVFSKEDMYGFMQENTIKSLEQWAAKNPTELQKISKYLKDVCEIRMKADKEKIKMTDKYTASAVSGYPAKYKKPNNKTNFEVIITEGDSACSCMENNRDKNTQGIFPIRGKIINALTTPTKKFFENEEVSSIFKICGYNGYSKNFDPNKFKPSKIIIATDADADGKHIECLLFGLFLKYLPFVIEQGKLFVANPPLYGLKLSNNKMKFFTDRVEYIEYIQKTFCKDNEIKNINTNKPYTNKEITKILYNNMDYIKLISHISNLYAIDKKLIEFLLYNRNLDFNKFKKTVEKEYKFLKVTNENGCIMIRGLVNSAYQTVFFNQRFLHDCIDLIYLIDRSEDYFIINGNKSSIYDLMNLFNSYEPKNLTRYKGLGEMPPKLLGESTIIPGMGRTLKQYTIEDVKEEINKITRLQSDKSAFIKGIKIRKEDII